MTDSEIHSAILDMGRKARAASRELVKLSSEQKNTILIAMADEIQAREGDILEANAKDLAHAAEKGLSKAMIDRLTLDPKRLKAYENFKGNLDDILPALDQGRNLDRHMRQTVI